MKLRQTLKVLATEVLAPAPGQGSARRAISSRRWRAVMPHQSLLREQRAPQGARDAHESTHGRSEVDSAPRMADDVWYVFTPPPTSGTCPVGHAEDLKLDLKCIL